MGDKAFATPVGNQQVYIGSRLYSAVDFKVTSLQDSLSFFVEGCSITIGEMSVEIIKDECYSKALGVHSETSDENTTRFSFTAMSTAQSAVRHKESAVTCKLKICMNPTNKCDPPTQCPPISGYQYTLTGQ